jgi:hypothetical protein
MTVPTSFYGQLRQEQNQICCIISAPYSNTRLIRPTRYQHKTHTPFTSTSCHHHPSSELTPTQGLTYLQTPDYTVSTLTTAHPTRPMTLYKGPHSLFRALAPKYRLNKAEYLQLYNLRPATQVMLELVIEEVRYHSLTPPHSHPHSHSKAILFYGPVFGIRLLRFIGGERANARLIGRHTFHRRRTTRYIGH